MGYAASYVPDYVKKEMARSRAASSRRAAPVRPPDNVPDYVVKQQIKAGNWQLESKVSGMSDALYTDAVLSGGEPDPHVASPESTTTVVAEEDDSEARRSFWVQPFDVALGMVLRMKDVPVGGGWTISANQWGTQIFGIHDAANSSRYVGLDFGPTPNSPNGSVFHWNQARTTAQFGITNHQVIQSPLNGHRLNLGATVRWGGRVLLVIGVVWDAYEVATSEDPVCEGVSKTTAWAGAFGGAKGGCAGGGALFSWLGPVGTGVGCLTGGLIGGVVGYQAGEKVGAEVCEAVVR